MSNIPYKHINYENIVHSFMIIFEQLWEKDGNEVLKTLTILFQCISSGNNICIPLESILINIPDIFIQHSTDYLVSVNNVDITDNMLISCLITLLHWPMSPQLSNWVSTLFKGLVTNKRFSVLITSIQLGSLFIIKQLYLPQLRSISIDIVKFLLFGYQHNVDVFHNSIPLFCNLLNSLDSESTLLQIENTPSSLKTLSHIESNETNNIVITNQSTIIQLIDLFNNNNINIDNDIKNSTIKYSDNETIIKEIVLLLQTLSFHFTGYPELYNKLDSLLSKYVSNS